MMDTSSLQNTAERVLASMRRQGFDAAQAGVSLTRLSELNIAHNEPSLLRSAEAQKLSLVGMIGGRKASTELSDLGDESIAEAVAHLFADAAGAPPDDANAVSAGQHARIVQGPQQGDAGVLADKVRELLEFRGRETPKMMIDEGFASHTLAQSHTLTSAGSDLACSLGFHSLSVFGTAREGRRSSSFNYTGGHCNGLAGRHAAEWFGITDMLRDTEQQIHTKPIEATCSSSPAARSTASGSARRSPRRC